MIFMWSKKTMTREFELFERLNGVLESTGIKVSCEGALIFLTSIIEKEYMSDLFVLDTTHKGMPDESKIFYPLSTWEE